MKNIKVKTYSYCVDVNVHNRDILLIYEKCHFQELLPFVRAPHNGEQITFKVIMSTQSYRRYRLQIRITYASKMGSIGHCCVS